MDDIAAKDQEIEAKAIEVLQTIYDPEIPVNIYELGLIYEIKVEAKKIYVRMTLTSPNCPVAESLPVEVEGKLKTIAEVEDAKVEIVFEPPWDKDMMSEAAKLELGFF